ncbi:hypothetical protein PHET_01863 [Paragonimus heterotremus]|uniref:Uncharacterized protein n=1 Tax=Paragonimus heterotremus TaxID=100268 RepID=A0A8J4WU77_9TREM|nr:hypothetical protein PHET_01863 [Paragonimus heterotremus]
MVGLKQFSWLSGGVFLVLNLARKYFNARSLDGVPLEPEEHMTSHLEARIFPVRHQSLCRSPNYSVD